MKISELHQTISISSSIIPGKHNFLETLIYDKCDIPGTNFFSILSKIVLYFYENVPDLKLNLTVVNYVYEKSKTPMLVRLLHGRKFYFIS